MAVKPTTRAGYRNSARPHRWRNPVPREESVDTGFGKFSSRVRPFRLAGQRDLSSVKSGSLSSPYGIGHQEGGYVSGSPVLNNERDQWETFPDDWQTFSNDWQTFPNDWKAMEEGAGVFFDNSFMY